MRSLKILFVKMDDRTPKRARVVSLPAEDVDGSNVKLVDDVSCRRRRIMVKNDGGDVDCGKRKVRSKRVKDTYNSCIELSEDRGKHVVKGNETKQCKLLLNLPKYGTFTNVDRHALEERSKRPMPVPVQIETTGSSNAKCKIVKADDTNILVRAMRIKKRQEMRTKRQNTASERTPGGKTKAKGLSTPMQARRKRPFSPPAVVTKTPSSSSSCHSDSQTSVRYSSPRLGATRVTTPPPQGIL
mmetsp:Transcript_22362/g.35784  ORF Transcript_22362/g.35784 Transcript_22362/m.35784 type:complete len:242 (-) Transcript_22362:1292-2017(-)